METNDTSAAANTAAVGSAEQASTSEGTQTQAQPDQFKNLKGEFNRKLSKMEQKLDAVLNAFNTPRTKFEVSTEADNAPEVDTGVKQYVDSVLVQNHQKSALQEAYEMFPELNPESESFDEKFYKAVDAEFSSNLRKDPRGPLKAAKLMALELGKMEQLTQTRILKDEARRSRILSEGSSATRETKKQSAEPVAPQYADRLAKIGVNIDKLNKRIKSNKEKYEGL